MKPFKINRKSWHYKLNQGFMNPKGESNWYMHSQWEPKHNNFCAYWRATMFRMLFAALGAVVAIGLLVNIGIATWNYPMAALMIVGQVLAIIAFLVAFVIIILSLAKISEWRRNRLVENEDRQPSLFMQKYLTHKQKICPMVEYD